MTVVIDTLNDDFYQKIREIISEEIKKDRYYSPNYDPNKILNLEEAAAYCGTCKKTLVSNVAKGKLISGATGKNYRFRVGDLDNFMFNK